MWSTFIMDFLLVLTAFGNEFAEGSQVAQFDFNSNGIIDLSDLLEMLSRQPPKNPVK